MSEDAKAILGEALGRVEAAQRDIAEGRPVVWPVLDDGTDEPAPQVEVDAEARGRRLQAERLWLSIRADVERPALRLVDALHKMGRLVALETGAEVQIWVRSGGGYVPSPAVVTALTLFADATRDRVGPAVRQGMEIMLRQMIREESGIDDAEGLDAFLAEWAEAYYAGKG